MNIDEARKILKNEDCADPKRALEAVAVVLRRQGLADRRFLKIAGDIESIADELPAARAQTDEQERK
jgi:hypothetical protein